MLCYLAGPIDFADPLGPTNQLRGECTQALINEGFAVYDPSKAYAGAMADPKAVIGLNDAAIERADCVLAMLPKGVASVGTPMEIGLAHGLGVPAAVVGCTGSMQLTAMGIPQYEGIGVSGAVAYLRRRADERSADFAANELLPLKYTGEAMFEPWRQHLGDAGFDLFVSETVTIPGRGFADIPCGINVEIPEGHWGMLTGRSSTIRDRGLLVTQGIIDNGYRGPMFAGVQNMRPAAVRVNKGDRIAQLILLPLFDRAVEQVYELSASDRGVQGFGSSGS